MSAKKKSTVVSKAKAKPASKRIAPGKPLLTDVRALILQSRGRVAQTVNAELTLLYWHIVPRIRKGILKEKRAEYGKENLQSLFEKLVAEFGRGYEPKNLRRMISFVEAFPNEQIVSSLRKQLTWWNWTIARKMFNV